MEIVLFPPIWAVSAVLEDKAFPVTLSIPEAARFAGVGVPVIKAAIEEGQILVLRLGKRVRVLRVPFEAMLMARKLGCSRPVDGENGDG